MNGGATWSSWYNQPTAQFYHVSTDNAFPYRVCGGQQESGSACVASRSDDGQITIRDWHPVGVEEYGYVAADPADPDVVYGGKVTRFDRRTGQVQDVGPPRGPNFRVLRTAPVLFAPILDSRPVGGALNTRALFFASNTLWKTINGGQQWTEISPDLSRETWDAARQRRRVPRLARGAADAARRHLHRRAVADRSRPSSGRAPTTG